MVENLIWLVFKSPFELELVSFMQNYGETKIKWKNLIFVVDIQVS